MTEANLSILPVRKPSRLMTPFVRTLLVTSATVFTTLVIWTVVAAFSSPWFFPSPLATAKAAITLTESGDLPYAIAVSYFRILTGWIIGCIVAIPIAIVAGRIEIVRMIIDPYFNFFRFVPPIAFLGIAILWFGIGEESKIAIIIYTSLFTVFMNTMAGAASIDENPSRAALSLGANRRQVLTKIVLPSTVPAILVGMRIGMGFSFMSVVAAEMVAANEGVGFLIFNARLFLKTANAFAGIITLGLMGLVADLVFRMIAKRIFRKHSLPF
jgi:ABC-type nitrate/sulfonate/bicarbonate transport system permease component